MHRMILEGYPFVDHVNGNGLDNRKANLRQATAQEQAWNRKKQGNCSSKYKGVCWSKHARKWVVHIKIDYQQVYLGYFKDEVEAALAYDEAARKNFGEFARTNFK
jgi:AP2 domain/HNH endonuclease